MPLWFALALPVAWLMGLLSIGIVQLYVDPDAQQSSGEFLDQLSWYLWIVGTLVVPLMSAVFARKLGSGWAGTVGVAALGALIYAAGTLAVFGIWISSYESITGREWMS